MGGRGSFHVLPSQVGSYIAAGRAGFGHFFFLCHCLPTGPLPPLQRTGRGGGPDMALAYLSLGRSEDAAALGERVAPQCVRGSFGRLAAWLAGGQHMWICMRI